MRLVTFRDRRRRPGREPRRRPGRVLRGADDARLARRRRARRRPGVDARARRRRRCARRCPSRRACATSSPSRATSRRAGGCAAARSRRPGTRRRSSTSPTPRRSGPGEPVRRPPATQLLDFELEIAAVIGADGEIAGFTLFNDWSARDVQRARDDRRPRAGQGQGLRDQARPVARDARRAAVRRRAAATSRPRSTVNGERADAARRGRAALRVAQLVAHAARDTRLRAGDVLGSGTLNRGCLLELGPLAGDRFLEPGDVVALEAPALGAAREPDRRSAALGNQAPQQAGRRRRRRRQQRPSRARPRRRWRGPPPAAMIEKVPVASEP